MAIEVERMIATLEARFDKYEKALSKAQSNTSRTFDRIESRGKRFEQQMSGIGGKISASFKGFAAGLVAGVGLQSIESFGRAIRSAVKDAADLVDMSDKVGINTDDLQRLIFGFSQAGVEADSVETSLTQWGKRIGEAFTQGGPLAELFKANNISLTDGNGALRSSVDLLREMANLIKGAGSDQERLALANVAFGKAGADMVVALKDGADGMNALMRATDEAGGVIEESVLRRAAEIDDRFDAITRTIETGVKSGLLDTAEVMVQIVDAAALLGAKLEEISGIPAPSWLGALVGLVMPGGAAGGAGARALQSIQSDFVGAGGKGSRFARNALPDDAFNSRFAGVQGPKTVVPDFGGSGSKKSKTRETELQREIAQIKERTAAVNAEATAQAGLNPLIDDYGFAADQARAVQDLLTAAQQAGVTVTPELRTQIEQLATGYATATSEATRLAESQDQVRQRMEDMRSLGKDVFGGFISDMIDGKSAAESLSGALGKIGDKLIDISLNSLFDSKSNGGFDLLGSLFGSIPGFANGTNSAPGGLSIVGEKGPELVNLPKGAQVIPNMQNMGGGVTVNFAPVIDARNADAAGLAKVQGELAKLKAELPAHVVKAVRDARSARVKI